MRRVRPTRRAPRILWGQAWRVRTFVRALIISNATMPAGGTMVFNNDDQPTYPITVSTNWTPLTNNLTIQVGGNNLTVGAVTNNPSK